MKIEYFLRVIDDAERWNARYASSDSSGWIALHEIRNSLIDLHLYKQGIRDESITEVSFILKEGE